MLKGDFGLLIERQVRSLLVPYSFVVWASHALIHLNSDDYKTGREVFMTSLSTYLPRNPLRLVLDHV